MNKSEAQKIAENMLTIITEAYGLGETAASAALRICELPKVHAALDEYVEDKEARESLLGLGLNITSYHPSEGEEDFIDGVDG